MSLNTSHSGSGVVLYFGERILLFYDGAELKLEGPSNVVPFKGTKKGRIFLTTHRIIFTNNNAKDTLQSFSAAFLSLSELELEQPIFGANFIKGSVKAEANGNWEGRSKLKLWFNKGGAIEFGRAMLECGRRACRVAQQMPPPPPYTPPTDFYPAEFNQYAPPQNSEYGFVPYNHFPDQPPANSVYMATAPPPYPGIAPISPAGTF
ncbi:DgyrCDS2699 [Dimorphilus gyrociliatus]|uniref:DgyrCDS2699 n=1 Tax=Dimorphilus gyrociliatus TaxID=2664684 RepID=A0A7I8VB87_9ANNE|nr:DgyrCDS2699 [Dimorphilus gyrociliatus]